jgi:hypothetical protein
MKMMHDVIAVVVGVAEVEGIEGMRLVMVVVVVVVEERGEVGLRGVMGMEGVVEWDDDVEEGEMEWVGFDGRRVLGNCRHVALFGI